MIKLLFHFGDGALRWSSVVLFFVVFMTLQCVASGVWVSNGQFIPAILSGAAMGKSSETAMAMHYASTPVCVVITRVVLLRLHVS